MAGPLLPIEEPEVTHYAHRVLKQAGVGDQLPTPVDEIVGCAELVVSQELTLDAKHAEFFSDTLGILDSALKKALGLVDLRESIVYLDPNMMRQRRRFVTFHEVGHKVLPWQRQTYLYLDDETTLDPDVRTLFEREANHFAAHVLFQMDRFSREADELPLDLEAAETLAGRYGASLHASIRRYVEYNRRPCAVLVLGRMEESLDRGPVLPLRRVIRSTSFAERFGEVVWPEVITADWPFTELLPRADGSWDEPASGEWSLDDRDHHRVPCRYQATSNAYNFFVFLHPTGPVAT